MKPASFCATLARNFASAQRPVIFSVTVILLAIALSSVAGQAASLQNGSQLPNAGIAGDKGSKLDGTPWDHREYLGKVQMIFYVDPDERKQGEQLEERLGAEKFAAADVQTSAVINMAATGLPNFMIGMTLSSKQKRYPHTIYAKDFSRQLVTAWGLPDNAYNFIILNRKGEVAYVKTGQPTPDELNAIISKIRELIAAK
jgi:predicted transcriptional regulator